jgi:hypothetical protein
MNPAREDCELLVRLFRICPAMLTVELILRDRSTFGLSALRSENPVYVELLTTIVDTG